MYIAIVEQLGVFAADKFVTRKLQYGKTERTEISTLLCNFPPPRGETVEARRLDTQVCPANLPTIHRITKTRARAAQESVEKSLPIHLFTNFLPLPESQQNIETLKH